MPAVNCGSYTLRNGVIMPKFGLGTWLSEPGQVKLAVEAAIDAGYRHIDCAYCYGNEAEVGEAIENKIKSGVVTREELFITTKIWNTYHADGDAIKCLETSLSDLRLDYVDLLLVHWPTSFRLHEDRNKFPSAGDSIDFNNDVHYSNCFKQMVDIKNTTSKVKAIGVSNFNVFQLKETIKRTEYVPDMLQIEMHPFNTCDDTRAFCKENNIRITAYSPLGSPARPAALHTGQKAIMEEQLVLDLAKKYNKSAAQILIKWSISIGNVCIPKSVTPARIIANSEIFDFELSQEEIDSLLALNKDEHYLQPARFMGSKFYPWPQDGSAYKE
jgi:alcohol dehydrogenase (NADP+)